MAIKYNDNTYKKLNDLLKGGGYQVRSGKGNFNTGHCVLEAKKVVVVNRYHSIEAQVRSLIELTQSLNLNEETMSDAQRKFYKEISSFIEAEQAQMNFADVDANKDKA